MSPWALVPVKRFEQAKTRLGAALDDAAREALATAMFDRVVGGVLASLRADGALGGVAVVTDGEAVAVRARAFGAVAIVSPAVGPRRALSAVVDEGLAALAGLGADAALAIMGDLPALEPDDVRALLEALRAWDVVLAPDLAGTGTNALATRLPTRMPTRFRGGDSLADHLAEARGRGLSVGLCERPGLAFDVDVPGDYARLGVLAPSAFRK